MIFPSILPVEPITSLPLMVMFPFNIPSIRISPLDLISPVIAVPFPIKLIETDSVELFLLDFETYF